MQNVISILLLGRFYCSCNYLNLNIMCFIDESGWLLMFSTFSMKFWIFSFRYTFFFYLSRFLMELARFE